MCRVIVVDAESFRSTCHGRDAYIHDHTHRNTYANLREATSETYGPWVYFHHINLPTLCYFPCFLLCFYFTLHIYHKNTKNIILSYLLDLTLVSDRVGIDNPLSRWLRGFICFVHVRGTRA